MSFPPNLGITNSFIIDSNCSIFQEFPSLLPQLDHICSPFSKHKMNGYSRIKKQTTNRSKSVDFSDLSLTRSSSTTTTPNLSKFKSQGVTPDLCTAVKITALHNSIPEHEHEHDGGVGEVFGVILGRKCCLTEQEMEITTPVQSAATVKRSFSIRRSASLSDGYSRIHHRHSAEDSDQNWTEFTSQSRCVKKKGKFFHVFRRLFGL